MQIEELTSVERLVDLVRRKFTDKEISEVLVVEFRESSGCSERSIRRFRKKIGLRAWATKDPVEVDRMVVEAVAQAGHACRIAAVYALLRGQGTLVSFPLVRDSLNGTSQNVFRIAQMAASSGFLEELSWRHMQDGVCTLTRMRNSTCMRCTCLQLLTVSPAILSTSSR
ncbi:hypothetical protein M427DRAFT_50667 [Gonapodya prolifera JEL478]|uniref:Uncharacterized protein n=1 Tax=Gonapodya prolifera (strain JEL478) TaxID=1344416 RepID=A0A139B014_GONPJ|nr:hypothetical protein M427DRAFT_50667 [Gonapodya prolifera JEL478]|eukprot:KXS22331.1 hypothetical protein M427DRAFT_50667 [Gonapodya prolifera JEL478]